MKLLKTRGSMALSSNGFRVQLKLVCQLSRMRNPHINASWNWIFFCNLLMVLQIISCVCSYFELTVQFTATGFVGLGHGFIKFWGYKLLECIFKKL